MIYSLAADTVLLLHLAFIVFVLAGGLVAAKWRWVPAIHLPAAAWGIFVEASGRVCPLTPLENALRSRAGGEGYRESFIERYVLALIYPAGLTPTVQMVLAGCVVFANIAVYSWVLLRRRRHA